MVPDRPRTADVVEDAIAGYSCHQLNPEYRQSMRVARLAGAIAVSAGPIAVRLAVVGLVACWALVVAGH